MIGTLATIGTAAASAASSAISQNKTNHQNQKLAEQQNAYNRQMYEQQLMDARDWYNEFESPMALRRQWQAAGFSPMAAIDGGSTGSGMQSVGASDAASFDYQSPFSSIGGNMMQGLAAVNNHLNDVVSRESAMADIARKREETNALRLQNEHQGIVNAYDRQNYIRDKNGAFYNLSKGFDADAASSFNHVVMNGAMESAYKVYDGYNREMRSAQLRYQQILNDKTKSEKDRIEAQKVLDRIEAKWRPILNATQNGLMQSQKDRLDMLNPLEEEFYKLRNEGQEKDNFWNEVLNGNRSDLMHAQTESYDLFSSKNLANFFLSFLGLAR